MDRRMDRREEREEREGKEEGGRAVGRLRYSRVGEAWAWLGWPSKLRSLAILSLALTVGLRLSLNGSACDLEMGLLVFWLALLPQELQYLKQEPKPELEELLMQMERLACWSWAYCSRHSLWLCCCVWQCDRTWLLSSLHLFVPGFSLKFACLGQGFWTSTCRKPLSILSGTIQNTRTQERFTRNPSDFGEKCPKRSKKMLLTLISTSHSPDTNLPDSLMLNAHLTIVPWSRREKQIWDSMTDSIVDFMANSPLVHVQLGCLSWPTRTSSSDSHSFYQEVIPEVCVLGNKGCCLENALSLWFSFYHVYKPLKLRLAHSTFPLVVFWWYSSLWLL